MNNKDGSTVDNNINDSKDIDLDGPVLDEMFEKMLKDMDKEQNNKKTIKDNNNISIPLKEHLHLKKVIIAHSESNNWDEAKKEWKITNLQTDDNRSHNCICGQSKLYYLFTITNVKNNDVLYPVGSSCIRQFENKKLDDDADIYKKLLKLLKAVENKKFVTLNQQYFSENFLQYLQENKVFRASKYNKNNPEEDYRFMLQMLNLKDKPSKNQQSKINALIMTDIIPFAKQKIKSNNVKDKSNSLDKNLK